MNYTDTQFAALQPYEGNFRTAIEADWSRPIPRNAKRVIRETYEAATGSRVPFRDGCMSCALSLLRRAGKLYFADKEMREAQAKTATASPERDALAATARIVNEPEKEAETTPPKAPAKKKAAPKTKTAKSKK